jgi:hypothetical protein
MQLTIVTLLLLLALLCFVLSAAGVSSRLGLESAGLALLTIALIINGWK